MRDARRGVWLSDGASANRRVLGQREPERTSVVRRPAPLLCSSREPVSALSFSLTGLLDLLCTDATTKASESPRRLLTAMHGKTASMSALLASSTASVSRVFAPPPLKYDDARTKVLRLLGAGPRMSLDDGRLVSNFAVAALKGEPLQIYGDGQATRSLMVRQRNYEPTRRYSRGVLNCLAHSLSTT